MGECNSWGHWVGSSCDGAHSVRVYARPALADGSPRSLHTDDDPAVARWVDWNGTPGMDCKLIKILWVEFYLLISKIS